MLHQLCCAVLCAAEGIEYCIVHPYISYPAAAAFVLTAMPGESSGMQQHPGRHVAVVPGGGG
jgi:hypothetical protein